MVLAENALFKYALSCVAATVAETATFPLDLTKTRLQIQGEGQQKGQRAAAPKHGMWSVARNIVRHEGFFGLWQGVAPAVLRHYVYTGLRVGVYEQMRDKIFKRDPDGSFPLGKALLSGGLGGAIAQFFASPTDLVKVRLQMEGVRRVQGLPIRYAGIFDVVRQTYAQSGVPGLWKGWVPNVQRAALVNMADLAAYDTSKHLLLKHTTLTDGPVTHSIASMVSGLSACVASTPADVVKTRIMNQPTDDKGRGLLYKGSVDCLLQTVRNEGWFALYKGFFPIWFRMAPWSWTFWVTYEQVRRLAGATSF